METMEPLCIPSLHLDSTGSYSLLHTRFPSHTRTDSRKYTSNNVWRLGQNTLFQPDPQVFRLSCERILDIHSCYLIYPLCFVPP